LIEKLKDKLNSHSVIKKGKKKEKVGIIK